MDETDPFNTLELILDRLEEVGLYAAGHKCTVFETSITWCGKLYSQGQVKHDPERLTGLATMRRPETAAELMQFLQPVNWSRTSVPRMAEVVYPLHAFLEEHLAGARRRTKRVESNRVISAGDWTSRLIWTWGAAQDLVAHAVALSHPKAGWTVLLFPGAPDEHWGRFLTQVPKEELDSGVSVEDMTHEPLAFLSGTF